MNSNKTNQTLKSNETLLTSIDTHLNGINTNSGQSSLQTGMNGATLTSINTTMNTIQERVDDIAEKINAKTKIIFNSKLTDGTNDYLDKMDYSNSPIHFRWQNDKNATAYIYKYTFGYTEPSEPSASQLYHSTAWETKIGAMNIGVSDYEAPYITKETNVDYYNDNNPNHSKMQWTSDPGWVFRHDFLEAPISIGISRTFGHYIATDFSSPEIYDTNPVGIIEGYYYAS